jgi:hypothetical protein
MKVNGIERSAARRLSDSLDYRYTLYDTSGNEVSDPSGEHIVYHSSATQEWTDENILGPNGNVLTKLKYNSSAFSFGPATTDWGTVDQMRVEVSFNDTYSYLAAAELGNGGYTIDKGEALVLDPNKQDIFIDFSAGSDSLNTFPSSFDGLLKAFLEYTDSADTSWVFELEKDTGSIHDSVRLNLSSSKVWSINSNSLEYQGPKFSWQKPESSFTGELVRVIVNTKGGNRYQVGTSSLSSPAIGVGDLLELESGNLTITP